ncbi:MAG: prepilin peptidase [Oscillospiraceae bacterium]|nr:prepilin peptidase [Oscillospiraceae bacterium]
MNPQEFVMVCVYILAGLLGLCVGSFLNVVIYRLPNEMSLSKPGSHCTVCNYSLKWYDNIPVLSYLFLGGKCRKCKAPISPRYMIVELLNGLLWLACAALFWKDSPAYAVAAAVVCSSLICIFFIDLEHMLIFNRFTLLVAAGGVVAIIVNGKWLEHLIGAVAGGVVFLGLYYGAIAILKKEGLGFGDVKYAAAAGLLLGWQKFILAMLLASVAAALVMIVINRVKDADKQTEYPFGPFLAVGTLVGLLAGDAIISWYIQLLLGNTIV